MTANHDPDRFRRIDALFDAALELPPAERAAFLERACGDDATLRADVITLLESVTTAEGVLGENVADFAAPFIARIQEPGVDPPLAAGQMLGPWRIVRELGRGGMGAVYLAERADGAFDLEVAVKVVKRGMDTAEVLRRFQAERRILASLDHPRVARVLDGGATADGRPYLVMEYIDGAPIDVWCDAQGLDVRRRVALFRDVCEAVHQAHRRLVVHRDVKPSNVLVTPAGEPKLLDFGIAKLLDQDDGATVTTARLLTPDYAAPEQIHGEPVTTATDVYALGRLLYLLLAGIRPPRAGGTAVAEDVITPSQAVRRARAQPANGAADVDVSSIARARATTPERLQATLRGDLDTIVLRALATEPARRYGSALQLGEDLDRWLRGLPVLARPDRATYRAAKFVRRNRVPVAAAGLFVVLLIAFAASMAAAQRRTAAALVRAQNERDTAEQVAGLLQSLFTSGAARQDRLDTLTVGTLLGRSVERVRAELTGRPVVQARMLRALGDAYRGLGLYDASDPLLRDAVVAHRALPDSVGLAHALNSVGLLELDRGRSADAEPWFREVLALREASPAIDDTIAVRTLSNLAASRQDQGDFEEADTLYVRAQAIIEAMPSPDTAMLSVVLNGRGMLAQRSGDIATAAALIDRIIEIDRALHGMEHPRIALDLVNLAYTRMRMGDLETADSLYVEGVDMIERTLGAEHPMFARGLAALANVRSLRGARAEAKPLFERAIAETRRTLGEGPDLAIALSQYADMLEADGDIPGAEALVLQAIDIERRAQGPAHPSVGVTTWQLAGLQCARDAFDLAASSYDAALDILTQALPPTHPRVTDAHLTYGMCLRRAGRYGAAEGVLVAGLEGASGGAATDLPPAARQLAAELAVLYDAWDRPTDAVRYRALADTTAAR